ncbi:MAG TPA: FAD-dependent oxidoreductase [Bacteroidales bacterium]|nr:FAD-dependent oxidoreductase [Bacteroidales bacterium]
MAESKKIAVIGGGIAGMEAAGNLVNLGFEVYLIERTNRLGGNVANWYCLFPDFKPSSKVVEQLKPAIQNKVQFRFGAEVCKTEKKGNKHLLHLNDGEVLECDAVVVASGFSLFDAHRKEEYGYGIYDNVITSADLEKQLAENHTVMTTQHKAPRKIAFIHCVGSRDHKVGNAYCSKVCCVTGVKQAIEVAKMHPEAEIYSFYMDLRMYDRQFEDLYMEAQTQHNVRFIRGRLSECFENADKTILLKAEDTLSGKPFRLSVDMVVLLVGMQADQSLKHISDMFALKTSDDRFLSVADVHTSSIYSGVEGVYLAGACTGPKSIHETLNSARAAALSTAIYLNQN